MTESIPKKPLKKGSLVFIDKSIYDGSVEALANDQDLPSYISVSYTHLTLPTMLPV